MPTTVEINGVAVSQMIVVQGPGFEIERSKSFHSDGRPLFTAGFSKENPFVFEASGEDAATLKAYFDQYLTQPGTRTGRSGSIIIKELAGVEVFRWNFYEFVPAGKYQAGDSGRTRFTMICQIRPDNVMHWRPGNGTIEVGQDGSNNTAADTRVEIGGVIDGPFYPTVQDDSRNNKLTLIYDFREGMGIYEFVKNTIEGLNDKRSMSVIQEQNGQEVSRRNYFEVFPIAFEQVSGYDLHSKLGFRLVLSYDYSEDAR